MSLSAAEISGVVAELAPQVIRKRINKVYQTGPHTIALDLGKWGHLVVSVHPAASRIHRQEEITKWGKTAAFGMLLRKHLAGRIIERLDQINADRIVVVQTTQKRKLVAELMGAGGNLLLLGPQDEILGVLRTRHSARLHQNTRYQPPPPRACGRGDRVRFTTPGQSLDTQVCDHYATFLQQLQLQKKKQALLRSWRAERKRLRRRKQDSERVRARARPHLEDKKRADLLLAHLHQVAKGAKKISLPDLFSHGEPIEIRLDEKLDPPQNAALFYKQYQRAQKTIERETERAEKLAKRIAELDALLREADELTATQIEAFDSQLAPEKRSGRNASPLPVDHKQHTSKTRWRSFESRTGKKILVGRSAKDNHELTFHVARGRDLWMHVTGASGPHVIVRLAKDESIDRDSLLDGATLAVFFSKERQKGEAEVVYAHRKNVRPVKGCVGTVTIAHPKRMLLRLEQHRIDRLLR